MKQVRINKIIIQNFKGIASGNFAFNGENTEIVADVMQGKTSVKQAFLWTLGLEIEDFFPRDKNNQLIDGLETRVELTLDIDGIEYKLSRSAKIKYKNKQFDGFKKDIYGFDGVPCTATDYKAKLCDLLGVGDFDTLKYLTILNHFNEGVDRKDRRALIYKLFVDNTIIDRLKDEPKYDLIANELKKGKSSDDISTMLKREDKRISDSKHDNETLLADKQAELAGFANIDYASIETELEVVESEIKGEEDRVRSINQADNKKALESQIKSLEVDLRVSKSQDKLQKEELERKVGAIEINAEALKNKGIEVEKEIEYKTKCYNTEKKRVFDETNCSCPHCHRPYEADKIEEVKILWEKDKEENLSALKKGILALKEVYELYKEHYANKLAELETAKQELADFKPNPRIAELETEIATLQAELEKCETNEIDTSHLDELKSRRNFLIVELGKKDSHDKLKAKIASLYAEQRELVNAEIVLAKKQQQLEQYTLDIIPFVNDSINSHFDGVKFKLFEELTATAQRNIKECCTITHNGIEYNSCSTGEKAEVNLEIVTTLQKALGLQMNIFVDDGSITNIKKQVPNQLIWLMNKKGKKLDCTRIDEIY